MGGFSTVMGNSSISDASTILSFVLCSDVLFMTGFNWCAPRNSFPVRQRPMSSSMYKTGQGLSVLLNSFSSVIFNLPEKLISVG